MDQTLAEMKFQLEQLQRHMEELSDNLDLVISYMVTPHEIGSVSSHEAPQDTLDPKVANDGSQAPDDDSSPHSEPRTTNQDFQDGTKPNETLQD